MPKTIKSLVILPAFLFLIACDDDASKTETGVFNDAPVAQLRYKSATQSGLTSAKGEFKYVEGETVTFSVGGIVLGSAKGAAQVTPFELLGVTPPTTQLAIQAEIRDRQVVTSFERVVNIALFLQALDADGNPDNGLDLTDRDTALADASLSFDQDLFDFADGNLRSMFGKHGIPATVLHGPSAAVQLYKSLGISVPGFVRTKSTQDSNADGAPSYITSSTYNDEGVEIQTDEDSDGNGVVDYRTTYGLNSRGDFATITESSDRQGDGSFRTIQTEVDTYDAAGRLTGYVTEYRTDGLLTRRRSVVKTLDANGNPLNDRVEDDTDGNGTFNTFSTDVYTYVDGQETLDVYEADTNSDAVLDSRETYAFAFDANGDQITQSTTLDHDFNNVPEHRTAFTFSYDANRRQTGRIVEQQDGTLTVLSRQVSTTTYNAEGRLSTTLQTNDDLDGSTPNSTTLETRTYDAKGYLTMIDIASNDGVDAIADNRTVITYTYDANGNQLSSSVTSYVLGEPTSATTGTFTYDANGNQLSARYDHDDDHNGSPDSSSLSTYAYEANGNGVRAAMLLGSRD